MWWINFHNCNFHNWRQIFTPIQYVAASPKHKINEEDMHIYPWCYRDCRRITQNLILHFTFTIKSLIEKTKLFSRKLYTGTPFLIILIELVCALTYINYWWTQLTLFHTYEANLNSGNVPMNIYIFNMHCSTHCFTKHFSVPWTVIDPKLSI